MGIGIHGAAHLMRNARQENLGTSILTLGVQDTHLTRRKLFELGEYYHIQPPEEWKPRRNRKKVFSDKNYMTGDAFWKFLGFEEIITLDFDDFEGCDVIHDLNDPDPPGEVQDRFDMVFDGGTLEHIFHLPNSLAALHKMVKVGGLIVLQSPSSNHMDHGFFMFSPTLFQDYFTANGYEIVNFQMIMYPKDSLNEPAWFMDYLPGSFKAVAHTGGLGIPNMSFSVALVVRKTAESTCDRIPQQSWYENQWKKAHESESE